MTILNTKMSNVERAILRHISHQNTFDNGARVNDILNATDDDPLTADALASLRARGYVYVVTMERVAWACKRGLWVTEAGKLAIEREAVHG